MAIPVSAMFMTTLPVPEYLQYFNHDLLAPVMYLSYISIVVSVNNFSTLHLVHYMYSTSATFILLQNFQMFGKW